ncbi:MAG: hypothetical protein HY819_17315 [Acidobacteria bacterium]|nr:hypothetical protein [Acidobacteriota bacterium]
MYIEYRGIGPIIFAFPFIFCVFVNMVVDRFFGEGYHEQHNWPVATAFLLAGVFNWVLGCYLNSRKKTVIDPNTGKEVIIYSLHDIFDIKIQYWSIPIILFSIFLFLK